VPKSHSKVNTALGEISANELGVTLCHTHLLIDPDKVWRPDPDYSMDSVGAAISEVNDYVKAGGKTLVEMTAIGQRRQMNDLIKISKETNSHLIITTGFSWEPSMPKFAIDLSINDLADLFIKEIEGGIESSSIKAGVIKTGSSVDRITASEEKVFRAAAIAQKKTGAPISTHTTKGTAATFQAEMFKSLSVDPKKVGIGHIGLSLQYGYIKKVASEGFNLIIDCIGKTKYYSDELRADIIKRLIDDGFLKQLLFGCDYGRKSYFVSYKGDPGYQFIMTGFIPILKRKGITEDQIKKILVENPANFYSV
jgi:phosphotriesterase-related protein